MKNVKTILQEQILFANDDYIISRDEVNQELGFIPEGCNDSNDYYHYSRGYMDALKYFKSELESNEQKK